MAQKLSLLISLLFALFFMHGPANAVLLWAMDSTGNSHGGVRFRNEIGGVRYGIQALGAATRFVWGTFQQNNSSSRKPVDKIMLFVESGNGVALATGNGEIHFNANYLGNFSGDAKREFTGVIYHEVTHVWQWNGRGGAPGGLIEGIADFVRLRSGYAPGHWVGSGHGDRWDKGYDVTARFLDYCDGLRKGFVAELNKKMKNGYSDGFFVELLGKSVHQLWKDYKAKYGH